MSVKAIIFCAAALLVQAISGQCIGSPYTTGLLGNPLIADGIGLGYDSITGLGLGGLGGIAPAAGGLAVTSSSPIAPTGVTVVSDKLTIEGPLAVGGQLPFMGSVAVEGVVPTGGQGGVSYSCGDGTIDIVSEGVAITPSLSLTGPTITPSLSLTGPAITPSLSLTGPINDVGLNRAGFSGCGRSVVF